MKPNADPYGTVPFPRIRILWVHSYRTTKNATKKINWILKLNGSWSASKVSGSATLKKCLVTVFSNKDLNLQDQIYGQANLFWRNYSVGICISSGFVSAWNGNIKCNNSASYRSRWEKHRINFFSRYPRYVYLFDPNYLWWNPPLEVSHMITQGNPGYTQGFENLGYTLGFES